MAVICVMPGPLRRVGPAGTQPGAGGTGRGAERRLDRNTAQLGNAALAS